MATVSHDPSERLPESRHRAVRVLVPEMWASLAICVIWLAVLFSAIFGPDIVNTSGGGTNTSTVPSAVVVALFASLATWVVAKYGFGRQRRDD